MKIDTLFISGALEVILAIVAVKTTKQLSVLIWWLESAMIMNIGLINWRKPLYNLHL